MSVKVLVYPGHLYIVELERRKKSKWMEHKKSSCFFLQLQAHLILWSWTHKEPTVDLIGTDITHTTVNHWVQVNWQFVKLPVNSTITCKEMETLAHAGLRQTYTLSPRPATPSCKTLSWFLLWSLTVWEFTPFWNQKWSLEKLQTA